MDEEILGCIQAAVTLARTRQIGSLKGVKSALQGLGYSDAVIDEAIKFWANYEANRKAA